MQSIKKWLKLKTWHRVVPRSRKKFEEPFDFLDRIIRLAATRASMASWGQPFEAIASWILLARGRDENARRSDPKEEDSGFHTDDE
jgi:hypothetical protein